MSHFFAASLIKDPSKTIFLDKKIEDHKTNNDRNVKIRILSIVEKLFGNSERINKRK